MPPSASSAARRGRILLSSLLAMAACERGCERVGTGPVERVAPRSSAGGLVPVLEVIDGDTIRVKAPSGTEKVRLLNIDTPEVGGARRHVLGFRASAFTSGMLDGKKVALEEDPEQQDRDRYGRMLRYVVTARGLNVNVEIVRSGWSAYYTKYGPSTRYHLEFLEAEKEARKEKKGIWRHPRFLSGGYLENARGEGK